jgi:small subunit ribosomal protein S20
MPRHKSPEKQMRINKKARLRNRNDRTKLRTAIRSVIDAKSKKKAEEALKAAVSLLDKSVGSGLIHKNNAANKKSGLYAHVSKLTK